MPPMREHRLETPEGDICWFEWGSRGAAPSLLLLHATGFHARLWDQVVAALPSGTHVIAPDHRGHGRSFKTASVNDWATHAEVLMQLVDLIRTEERRGGQGRARQDRSRRALTP